VKRWQEVLRLALIAAALLGGTLFFGWVVHQHYPIQKWLFWHYATYWLSCIVFSIAAVSVGHVVIVKTLGRPLPIVEHFGTAFAIGLFGWFVAMFLAGALGLYNTAAFYGIPIILTASGVLPLSRYLVRLRRKLRWGHRRARARPTWHLAVLAFGLIGLGMCYFLMLNPENVQFDARWKHLALAEEYAVHGAIRRFPEGWTVATYPHLVSYVFTWGFLLPGGNLFDHVELCAHIELTCFLWILVSVGGTVRTLVPKAPASLVWAARFLFPGIFLYDSSLAAGADHIGAVFALPVFTLMVRCWRVMSPRYTALLAIVMVGAAMAKYTSALLLFPVPAGVLVFRGIYLGLERERLPKGEKQNWWRGPVVALIVGLVISSPHWLKNILWYGDPVYPVLHSHLSTLTPWFGQDATDMYEWGYKDYQFWRPTHDLMGFAQSLGGMFNWSFIPHDYSRYHGRVPVVGSLFTLLLFTLPMAPISANGAQNVKTMRARLWALIGTTHLALFLWYWTHHQDRYLQSLMPWMAAATATMIILLWRTHLVARLCLVPLVALQLIWGGDVYFIQTHAMTRSPLKKAIDMIEMGYKKEYDERFDVFRRWTRIEDELPDDAHVLLHEIHNHLGVGRTTVNDWQGWQYGLNYGDLPNTYALQQLLSKELGVTHMVWPYQYSRGWDSLAGDILFFDLARRANVIVESDKLAMAALPPAPPDEPMPPVAILGGCGDGYAQGLYRIDQLNKPVFGPRHDDYPEPLLSGDAGALVDHAGFVGVDTQCNASLPLRARGHFTLMAQRKQLRGRRKGSKKRRHKRKPMELWYRSQGTPKPLD